MTHQEARERFVAAIMRERHCGFSYQHLYELMRLAQRLHNIGVRIANGHQTPDHGWDEAAAKRDERREAKIEHRIAELCKQGNVVPEIQGDPRGWPLGLKLPSGREIGVPVKPT